MQFAMSMAMVVLISTGLLVYQFITGSLAGDDADSLET
jgi:hypothetical protein